jgi:hypothetical protein
MIMAYGCFTDRNEPPTDHAVEKALGVRRDAWRDISDYLTVNKKAKAKYKYYGKNYGWAQGFSKSGKSILALYPDTNDFCVQFILSVKQEAAVLSELSNAALRDIIAEKEPIHEGKWIFARFGVFKGVEEIKRLVDIRLDTK